MTRSLAAALLLLCACSGAGGGSTDPTPVADARHGQDEPDPGASRLTPEEFHAYCGQLCRPLVACEVESSLSTCVSDCDLMAPWLRGDLIAAAASCIQMAECSALDGCDRSMEGTPLPNHTAFMERCGARYGECSFDTSDGICGSSTIPAINNETMTELSACLDEACAGMRGCLDGVANLYGFEFL